MAKKQTTRKPNISAETLERARREMAGGAPVVSTPTPNQTSVKSSVGQNKNDNVIIRSSSKKRTMTQEELSHEYGYVLQDLRSMGVLAFALFIGMIAVALVINQIA